MKGRLYRFAKNSITDVLISINPFFYIMNDLFLYDSCAFRRVTKLASNACNERNKKSLMQGLLYNGRAIKNVYIFL